MTKRRKAADIEKPYEPTSREQAAVDAHRARARNARPAPRLKVNAGDGVNKIAPEHPDLATGCKLLMEAVGTSDPDFAKAFLTQMGNASSLRGTVDEEGLNFMLSVVKGIGPKDQMEAMLAAQMAAVHMAMMTFTRRLAHVENIPQQDSAVRALNKLARTFAAQMEALKRYRTGGTQTVTVQHVNVLDGGQAIVGNVAHGGEGRKNGG